MCGVLLLAAATAFGVIGVRQYITFYRPVTQQADVGRVVGISANYGKTVYVTRREKRMIDVVYLAPLIPAAMVATCLGLRYSKTGEKERGALNPGSNQSKDPTP
jgi:hypothetical protein